MLKHLLLGTVFALAAASPASATLNVFQTYVGSYGLSTDGAGSVSQDSYLLSASVPAGATVTSAYLYESNYDYFRGTAPLGVLFAGSAVSFGPTVSNTTACCGLYSARADVTNMVASLINGGPGGVYSFPVHEADTGGQFDLNGTDGTALVVVYQLSSLPTQTVAILDGFADVTGDTATLNFGSPLDPTMPGFHAEMDLGIGFSATGDASTVTVNGTTITQNAGNWDDGYVPDGAQNGNLITVGGFDDPFSPFLPSYANDHERYDIAPFISQGATSINVQTVNPSGDDNIFLATFLVSSAVPEPSSWAMILVGFGVAGMGLRRSRAKALTAA